MDSNSGNTDWPRMLFKLAGLSGELAELKVPTIDLAPVRVAIGELQRGGDLSARPRAHLPILSDARRRLKIAEAQLGECSLNIEYARTLCRELEGGIDSVSDDLLDELLDRWAA